MLVICWGSGIAEMELDTRLHCQEREEPSKASDVKLLLKTIEMC